MLTEQSETYMSCFTLEVLNFLGVNLLKFKSRKDWWLSIIVWITMILAIGSGLYELIDKTPNILDFIIIFTLCVILPIFILWMWLTTYYFVDENNLIIKFGPFKKIIPLDTIKSVRKTTNPLSSPALSLKRLEIVYGYYNSVLISPIHRDEFIEILSIRCKNIKIIA
jgi:membrane protein YdbS with pleckstrin-like domain